MDNVASIRQVLNTHIAEQKKSQTGIAKELDISKTTLSLFLNGVYTGDNEEIANKVRQYLIMGNEKRALAKKPKFCENLSNADKVLKTVRMTHVTNDILLLYGPAGCGKTTALKHYKEINSGVIYIEADATTNSLHSMLTLIVESIGEEPKGSTAKMMRFLINKLSYSNRLIIIDEAQHLTIKTVDCLRALNDKAYVSIVFSGNPKILKRMYGRMEEDYDQVHSRIGYLCSLTNRHGIEDIMNLYDDFDISDNCFQLMGKIARRKGGLRRMVKQCSLAMNIANATNEPLSPEHFDEADEYMGIIA